MQLLLHEALQSSSVPKAVGCWSHGQAGQPTRKLRQSPTFLRPTRQACITASIQMKSGLSNPLQHPVDSFLQQLHQFTSTNLASAETSSANRPKATQLWHGVFLQKPLKPEHSDLDAMTTAACQALYVPDRDRLQDVLNCLLLAETAYRVHDHSNEEVESFFESLRQDFPPDFLTLQSLQWSQPHVSHRYLLAESKDALYVAFVGTKQRRDIMTNANIMHEAMWPKRTHTNGAHTTPQAVPSAHSGFLYRARGVPIAALYNHARKSNKRLVLTGHSLGGAVALLCTLDLLHDQQHHVKPAVACLGFATPAVGNQALAEHVQQQGWAKHITNYLVPEDVISRLLPSQQLYAADQAAAPDSFSPIEPTAPAEQMFGHHPALWASHASTSAPSHQPSAHNQPSVPQSLHPGSQQTKIQSATSQSAVQETKQPQLIAMNNILPLHHTLFSSGVQQLNNAVPHNETSSSSRLSIECHVNTAHFSPANHSMVDGSLCGIAQPACSDLTSSVNGATHQPQQNITVTDDSSLGFWRRTVQLARLVSFPLRMSRAYYSYVPVGQQLYLEPQAITSMLQPPSPLPDTSTDHAAPTAGDNSEHSAASSSSSSLDVVVQRRKELLGRLWMHRMPTYRARMQQILYAALDLTVPEASLLWDPLIQPPPASKATGAAAQSGGRHVAPQVEVLRAEIPACALLGSSHLLQAFKDGMTAVADQAVQRWFWSRLSFVSALRHQMQSRPANVQLQIHVVGHGLEHCTGYTINLGSDMVQGSVLQQPFSHDPSRSLSKRASMHQSACDRHTVEESQSKMAGVTVAFDVPFVTMQKLYAQLVATGDLGLTMTAQSDFYLTNLPVTLHTDSQALQDRVEGLLSVCKTLSAHVIRRALCNAALVNALKVVE